jgi:hypothetical protein
MLAALNNWYIVGQVATLNKVGYARRNVIGSRSEFVIAFVRSSMLWNICI